MSDVNVDVQVLPAPNVTVTQAAAPSVAITMAGAQGPQGLQGIQGPQGPAGSGDKHYEQAFYTTASVDVVHNLGKRPAVTVVDSAGDECVGDIDHLSDNELMITFSAAFSGKVYCN